MSNVLFLRRGFGFTQEQVSEKLNISRKLLRDKENNKKDFTKTEMIILKDMFKEHKPDITIDEIFFK